MNKTAFKLFICCTLIAAATAFLLLCFNGFCFGCLITDYSSSPHHFASGVLRDISGALREENGRFYYSGGELLPPDCWCILIDPEGAVVWSQNMPGDIPGQYSLNDVARLTRWYLNDYPVYVRTEDYGLLVLGLPKNAVGKYELTYSMAWFDALPGKLVFLVAANILLSLGLAAVIGIGLYRRLRQVWQGVEDLSREQAVHVPEAGLTIQVARAINRCSAAMERKNAALSLRDQAKRNWVNGISHDIRTPLAVIMGRAEAIQSGAGDAGSCRESASVILAQSQKVRQLVADLNLMSALENDMESFRREPVKICPLIRSVVTDILNGQPAPLHSIELELKDEASAIFADRLLIQRALFNLISNSINHNPQGCGIHITQYERAGQVFILVADNGLGVPQQVLKNIGHMPDSAHGLGLPMVYRIIQVHGGSFHAANDGGFKTEIKLPAYLEEAFGPIK